jgi:hypothetical protein
MTGFEIQGGVFQNQSFERPCTIDQCWFCFELNGATGEETTAIVDA